MKNTFVGTRLLCKCNAHLLAGRKTTHRPVSSTRDEQEESHGQGHHHLQQKRCHMVPGTWGSKREQTGHAGQGQGHNRRHAKTGGSGAV